VGFELVVRDRTPGREGDELLLADLPQRLTLRDLIRTRVREEVARYNADRDGIFRGLVRPEDAEETRCGYRVARGRRLEWEKQARVAEEAFERNGFFVLVDGTQVDDLDEELDLGVDTDVCFVRLVPLVGG
jgi:hypothetical protein